ncbi:CHAT domain-containing protein [Chryseolinea lacunae]|uniref:CHAT domain-containing protein n=1 Tax=Chryseolinea lacunae TaxID=2801331 RepID=A0ABS1KLE9_9BACT|nr:CHAT domain-containing protein [Chryseolinea lacunae]MBL0740068.1 CHAT domain-containing protein [Chryseolinea lacunae]
MKRVRLFLFVVMFIVAAQPLLAQNKKFDKSLKKVDASFASGSFEKASSGLQKLKKSVVAKMGQQNSYMPGIIFREARINLSLGLLTDFDKTLNDALLASQTMYGDNSATYANMLLDVAELYNEYGNYRIARDYITKAKELLTKANLMSDAFKGRIALAEGEALTGQGFCNEAIAVLRSVESYYAGRAVEKETKVDGASIKTQRVPDEELLPRHSAYARLLTLTANAYSKKGALISADSAFKAAQTWIRKNQRFMGETGLYLVQNNFLYARMLVDNGNEDREKELEFDNLLNDLKRRTTPTSALGHDLYLAYLHNLLEEDNRARYLNVKLEYEKMIDKYFPKASLVRINLKAVEFDSKVQRDKTKDLENDAMGLINSKSLPKNYRTTERTLNFLYDLSLREKRYTNAENYLNQITDIEKELCGENSPTYHLARLRLAGFYLDYTNKIEEASKIYDESYTKIVSKEIGPWQKDNLDILNHLAFLYEFSDKYAQASATLSQASDVARSKYSNNDPDYGVELDRIAQLEIKLGQYEKAEQHLAQALTILEEKRKDENRIGDYVHLLDTQAKLYGIKGLFDEAETNLERSAKLIKNAKIVVGSELSAAEELTALFIQLGRYSDADHLLSTQIPEYEKLYGGNSLRLIEPLVNKGRLMLAKGDYTEAERIATRANQIAVKSYGEISTKTAPTQKLLSDIYYTLGDYDKAEKNVTKAITSQEKQFGRNHIEVAKSLSQLALIKFYKGDKPQDVERLMLESRDIMAARLGKENPQYAEILKNVAVLYISEKKFDLAFNSLTVAENIWRTKTGTKNNINAASIYTLTGDVYYQLKNYKKAEEFYNQSKNLYEKFFSATHPEYVKVLSKLSKVAYMQKDYKRSKRLIEESLSNYENFIKQFFPALSEREKAKYWNTIKGDFEFYNTLALSNLDDFRDLSGKVYNYQLLTKALLLSSSIKIRERILHSTDDQLKLQYSMWVEKKEKLTLALSMSASQLLENGIDPGALQSEVERLEKDLSQKSELFGQSFDNKRITFEDVKKALKTNETAIEMVRYRYFNHDFTDSVIYAALYLKSDISKPKAILLKDGKKLETRYFKFYRNAITGKIPDEVSYGVFWKPLQDEIGQSATIYLSADGVYNQINLEAIPTPDGKYVIDNANIVLVSNTKDLYLRKVKSKATAPQNTASMFGNPTFYAAATADQSISALPGTEKEVNQLQFMLKQKGWITAEYVEQTASEENVKEINSPKIFHIATHGFYRPTAQVKLEDELQGSEATLNQNPLMRTGLLLRGAGDLMDKTEYNFNMENGILTAYEAMSLNLDKTDLVVLSACETGLGELEAGEGVYGLQRAFLVAGAKVLIMSMFKVDDDATQKLMLKFYQKWLNSNNLRQSFIEAKKELRVEYPEPIYWGAFMMIGLD